MRETDRPLGPSAVNEVEHGARRVDSDDLVALAYVLGVNPNALLLPPFSGPDTHTDLSGVGSVSSSDAWLWAQGLRRLNLDLDQGRTDEQADAVFRGSVIPETALPGSELRRRAQVWIDDQLRQQERVLEVAKTAGLPAGSLAPIRERIAQLNSLDPSDPAVQRAAGLYLPGDDQ